MQKVKGQLHCAIIMFLAIIQHHHWEGKVTIMIIWTDSESVTQVFGVQLIYIKQSFCLVYGTHWDNQICINTIGTFS